MQKPKIKEKLNCCKCGHRWEKRRKNIPLVCPSCKNPNWNKSYSNEIINLILS